MNDICRFDLIFDRKTPKLNQLTLCAPLVTWWLNHFFIDIFLCFCFCIIQTLWHFKFFNIVFYNDTNPYVAESQLIRNDMKLTAVTECASAGCSVLSNNVAHTEPPVWVLFIQTEQTRPPDTPDTVKSIWNYSDSLCLINLDSELWHKNDDVFIHLHLQDQYTNKRLWKGQRYNKWHKCGPSVNICHSFQAGSKHFPKRWSRRVIFGVFEVKMISSVLQIWVKTLHTSKN